MTPIDVMLIWLVALLFVVFVLGFEVGKVWRL